MEKKSKIVKDGKVNFSVIRDLIILTTTESIMNETDLIIGNERRLYDSGGVFTDEKFREEIFKAFFSAEKRSHIRIFTTWEEGVNDWSEVNIYLHAIESDGKFFDCKLLTIEDISFQNDTMGTEPVKIVQEYFLVNLQYNESDGKIYKKLCEEILFAKPYAPKELSESEIQEIITNLNFWYKETDDKYIAKCRTAEKTRFSHQCVTWVFHNKWAI